MKCFKQLTKPTALAAVAALAFASMGEIANAQNNRGRQIASQILGIVGAAIGGPGGSQFGPPGGHPGIVHGPPPGAFAGPEVFPGQMGPMGPGPFSMDPHAYQQQLDHQARLQAMQHQAHMQRRQLDLEADLARRQQQAMQRQQQAEISAFKREHEEALRVQREEIRRARAQNDRMRKAQERSRTGKAVGSVLGGPVLGRYTGAAGAALGNDVIREGVNARKTFNKVFKFKRPW